MSDQGIMGEGSFTGTPLTQNVTVGKYSSIATEVRFSVDGDHLCIPNKKCVFTTIWGQPEHPFPIKIGNDVWIGRGVIIMDNVTIGHGAIIGSGSIVTKHVPPYAVVVGNPAKVKKYRFNKEIIEKLLKIKWWEWDKETIIQRIEDFKDIKKFIEKYA